MDDGLQEGAPARQPVTRFAPSPTGQLHLGHIFSALVAARLGEGYLLRIDDIDHTRCRPAFTDQLMDDLSFLGLAWQGDPPFQSRRLARYAAALDRLREMELVYPCYLTRAELAEVLPAPHGAPRPAPTATDSALPASEAARRAEAGVEPAWRLRTARAMEMAGDIGWTDLRRGEVQPVTMAAHGDVVVARRDIGTSYHLSVVIDDMMDGVTLVTRGTDLEDSTHVHRLLQAVLGIAAPAYYHHDLVRDAAGRRLAKRHDSLSVAEMRRNGLVATDILSQLPSFADSAKIRRDFYAFNN
ncbi:MAG: tRNA glutamyl-Q(34) synthetase GluQRS [Pseudomonadota bacterium]|nr:tRNA glutamyl-Q(34) synthetase GluQRS [Pseudomonadota bacterium]